jgi:hypothetical protein
MSDNLSTGIVRLGRPALAHEKPTYRGQIPRLNASLAIAGEPEDSKSSGGDSGEP